MSKIERIKTCERCGKEFLAPSGYTHFCKDCKVIVSRERLERSYKARGIVRQNQLLKGIENIDYVIDLWNGLPTTRITGTWFKERHPGRTLEEYITEFPDAKLICEKVSNAISESTKRSMSRPEIKELFSKRISGNNNPNSKSRTSLEQRQRISPFSKSFKKYDNLSNEEKRASIKALLKTDDSTRMTTSIEYWLKKGYTEEEAKEKLSERQRTFTLEKCIKKYGEEKGLEIWKDRQFRWKKSLVNSFEKDGDNRTPISKFEKDCKELICRELNIEIPIKQKYISDKLNNHYSYDLTVNHKIIEFNGDYWHMNSSIYKDTDYNKTRKMYASEIWKYDSNKIKCANSYGYEVLTIWESDYRKNKNEVIQKCINFLK